MRSLHLFSRRHVDFESVARGLKEYLDTHRPLGLPTNTVEYIGGKNHWHFRAHTPKTPYVVRMQNPNRKPRFHELTTREEALVLKRLSEIGIAPKPYYDDAHRFSMPVLMIEDIPDGVPLNKMAKPLASDVFRAAASAIAQLNRRPIFPSEFDLTRRLLWSVPDTFTKHVPLWRVRLMRIGVCMLGRGVSEWFKNLWRVVRRAAKILERFNVLLTKDQIPVFHFNGAHAGNLLWRAAQKRICFIDLSNYVSFSRNVAFTAGRFLTSLHSAGRVPQGEKKAFLKAYLAEWYVPGFSHLLDGTILERSVADMVYDFVRGNQRFIARYEIVCDLLDWHEQTRIV